MTDSFTPIFQKLVFTSIWMEPDHVRIVWITLLALKDPDHVVRYDAFNIAQIAHKTESEVLDALKVLESPDTRKLEPQPFEGRRIERVPDGWKILNGHKYQEMMRVVIRRHYQAAWQKKRRDALKSGGTQLEREYVRLMASGKTQEAEELMGQILKTMPELKVEQPSAT